MLDWCVSMMFDAAATLTTLTAWSNLLEHVCSRLTCSSGFKPWQPTHARCNMILLITKLPTLASKPDICAGCLQKDEKQDYDRQSSICGLLNYAPLCVGDV
jgi:hypothetical protein